MSIYFGTSQARKIYFGTQPIKAVYLGNTLIWPDGTFSISEGNTKLVGPSSGSFSLTVTSPYDWVVSTNETWISFDKSSGDSGTSQLTISYSAQDSDFNRSGVIIFTYNNETYTFTLNQSTYELTIVPDSLSFDPNDNLIKSFSISTDYSWSIQTSDNWYSVSKVSGTGNDIIEVTATTNGNINTRTSSLTVACGSISKTVTLRQAANPYISCDVTEYTFETGGETKSVTVTSNDDFTVSVPSWLTYEISTKSGNNTTVNLTANNNTSEEDYEGQVFFNLVNTPALTAHINVSQPCIKDWILVDGETSATYKGDPITITCGGHSSTWTANVVDAETDWITIRNNTEDTYSNSATGTSGQRLGFRLISNSSAVSRTGTVNVSCGTASAIITVTQIVDSISISPNTEIALGPELNSYADITVTASNTNWNCNINNGTYFTVEKLNNTTARVSTKQANSSITYFDTINFVCGNANTTVDVKQGFYYVNTGTEDVQWLVPNAIGQSHSLTINSYSTWTAVANQPWISVNNVDGIPLTGGNECSGENGDTLYIFVRPNNGSERNGSITITCGTVSINYTITQPGAEDEEPSITFSDGTTSKTVKFFSGGTKTISILSNVEWIAESTGLVTAIEPTSGNYSDTATEISYTVAENERITKQTSYIYIKHNNETYCTLEIISEASAEPVIQE